MGGAWPRPQEVEQFLELLGKQRCQQIKLVSCDMASWITGPVSQRCPNASVCYDPFHLVKLATDALDEIRREAGTKLVVKASSSSPASSRARGSPCGRTRPT